MALLSPSLVRLSAATNAVTHVGVYLVALVAGAVATALTLRVTLRPVA
jgi:hypothetical protein